VVAEQPLCASPPAGWRFFTASVRPACPTGLVRSHGDDARHAVMDYRHIITIDPGKRGGRPCIRHMRITVADVLGWLAAGLSHEQILADFPELTGEDIRACLAYAAERERRLLTAAK
jgi:uncharacterized protein (DUF433 family)